MWNTLRPQAENREQYANWIVRNADCLKCNTTQIWNNKSSLILKISNYIFQNAFCLFFHPTLFNVIIPTTNLHNLKTGKSIKF